MRKHIIIAVALLVAASFAWAGPPAPPVSTGSLPSQSGASGKLLTSNGSVASWTATLTATMDDSAAQFTSATASKGKLKFDQSGISDTKTITLKWTATDNVTLTPTLTSTTLDFGSVAIDGLANLESANGKTIAVKSGYYIATGTSNFILPTPASPYGNQYCFKQSNNATNAITVIPVHTSGVMLEKTDGTGYCTADDKLVSGGGKTDKICLVSIDATHYDIFSSTGTWTCTAH